MKKSEIVSLMAEKSGLTKKDSELALTALVETIVEVMATGEEVNLAGLGKFKVKDVAAKTCRNPKTGEAIEVPAKKAPKFAFGKAVKDAVKNA